MAWIPPAPPPPPPGWWTELAERDRRAAVVAERDRVLALATRVRRSIRAIDEAIAVPGPCDCGYANGCTWCGPRRGSWE